MVSSNPTNQNSLLIRIKIKISELLLQPSFIIGSILVIILTYLVIAPIISIFSNSVSLTMMDAMLSGGKDGAFTYKYVDRVFTSSISEKIFWTPLKNSITVSFFATLIALALGLILASLVTSTNIFLSLIHISEPTRPY